MTKEKYGEMKAQLNGLNPIQLGYIKHNIEHGLKDSNRSKESKNLLSDDECDRLLDDIEELLEVRS